MAEIDGLTRQHRRGPIDPETGRSVREAFGRRAQDAALRLAVLRGAGDTASSDRVTIRETTVPIAATSSALPVSYIA